MKPRSVFFLILGMLILAPHADSLMAATDDGPLPPAEAGGDLLRSFMAVDRSNLSARAWNAAAPRIRGAASIHGSHFRGFGFRPRRLTPARAFLYSAAVPGLGQLMQGSPWGYAFLGVEVIGWTGRTYYRGQGSDKEDDYRAYADRYYQRDKYQAVVDEIYREYRTPEGGSCDGCQSCGEDCPDYCDVFACQELGSYFALDTDVTSGHYYEDIGKLDKYIFGWEDWGPGYDPTSNTVDFGAWPGPGVDPERPWPDDFPALTSSLRATYQDMRREANDNFDRASNFSWVILLNRVVSASHAAYMAWKSSGIGSGETGVGESSWRVSVGRGAQGKGFRLGLKRDF